MASSKPQPFSANEVAQLYQGRHREVISAAQGLMQRDLYVTPGGQSELLPPLRFGGVTPYGSISSRYQDHFGSRQRAKGELWMVPVRGQVMPNVVVDADPDSPRVIRVQDVILPPDWKAHELLAQLGERRQSFAGLLARLFPDRAFDGVQIEFVSDLARASIALGPVDASQTMDHLKLLRPGDKSGTGALAQFVRSLR